MRRFLRSLDLADYFVVLAGLALVVGLQFGKYPDVGSTESSPAPVAEPAPPPSAAAPATTAYQPRSFGSDAVFTTTNAQPRTAAASRDFKYMAKTGSYFGAFAQSNDGAYGYVTSYATFPAARAAALASCVNKGGTSCHIIAELRPDTQGTITGGDETLSHWQSRALYGLGKETGVRAFARAIDGAYGIGRGPDLTAARANALRYCHAWQDNHADYIDAPCDIVIEWPQ